MNKLKRRFCFSFALALVFLTFSQVFAIVYNGDSEEWSETYSSSPQYDYPPDIIGTSMMIIDDGPGAMMLRAGIAVSIYQYNPYGAEHNYVHLRVAVTTNSTAVGSYIPVHVDQVIICIQKTGYYDEQSVEVQDSGTITYSQGMGLVQPSYDIIPSTAYDRSGLIKYTLEGALNFMLGLIPGWSVVDYLINIGDAFDGTPQDFNHAYFGSDTMAYCWWTAEMFDFHWPTITNPINQYCFNTLFWIQEKYNPGAGGIGIKVWAKLKIDGTGAGYFDQTWYETPKLDLTIVQQSSGGGGGGRLP